ncbi:MAG: hypothetical protein REJ50_16575, partial [Bordetella sp.]|nr:hypothetical protein [Bordetella sp.]
AGRVLPKEIRRGHGECRSMISSAAAEITTEGFEIASIALRMYVESKSGNALKTSLASHFSQLKIRALRKNRQKRGDV